MHVRHYAFEAIGTHWTIQIRHDMSSAAWSQLKKQLQQRIEMYDKTYSRFRDDSWVSMLHVQPGTHTLPPDAFKMIALYEKLYKATNGLVTPLIGQLLSDAGYDAHYSFTERQLLAPPRWEEALSYTRTTITTKQPILLDFGAAGKGYLVDIIAGLIKAAGVAEYIVDASGDILHRSARDDITIGLENPLDTTQAVGVVRLHNQSLCASAGTRRTWGKYHHIMNPQSLQSPRDVLATWVVADETILADGAATALFFVKPEVLKMYFPSISVGVLYADMTLEYTPDFPVELYAEVTHATAQ